MIKKIIIASTNVSLSKEISRIIRNKNNFEIITNIHSSVNLINEIKSLKPNIIVLVEALSDMSIYSMVLKIMKTHPVPCLLINLENSEKIKIDQPRALDYGIVDNITIERKNDKIINPANISIRVNILSKLNVDRFLIQINKINAHEKVIGTIQLDKKIILEDKSEEKSKVTIVEPINGKEKRQTLNRNLLIIIGASTGGPRMIVDLISKLPIKFPPVLVVQHMPDGFVESFASRINNVSLLNVQQASEDMLITDGFVYVAPGGRHMEIVETTKKTRRIKLSDGVKVNFVKPSVDVTMISAANIYGKDIIGVILTGMGSDGKKGSKSIRDRGGRIIALNEEESIIYGMNKSVIEAGLADYVLGVDEIINQLIEMIYL